MRYYERYLEDLSTLTGLPKSTIEYMMKTFRLVLGHELYECMVSNEDMEVMCLGFGKLGIELDNSTDTYKVKFKLSNDMKKIIDTMLDTQKSPLVTKFEEDLVKKVTKAFKSEMELDDE